MKKMNILLMSISAILHMISCNKETEPDLDDLPNNNFRILKVEQTKRLHTPPFLFNSSQFENNIGFVTVEYEYYGDSVIIAQVTHTENTSVKYPLIFSNRGSGVFSIREPVPFTFFQNLSSLKTGMYQTFVEYNKNRVNALSFQAKYKIIYDIPGQIRRSIYEYDNERLVKVKSIIQAPGLSYEKEGYIAGESVINSWEATHVSKFSTKDDIGYAELYDERAPDGIIVSELLIGANRELNIILNYTTVPSNMPKELIRKVNQALSGVMRGPFEDYVYNWQVDFLYPGNNFLKKYVEGDYKEYVERLQSSDKTILADWLWSFAHPSFNVLPEQDKLIASKRITGRKIVDIIDDQPVYQDVDSIATFPYVFDPIAKTLEIAGLKIWYEVLD